MNYCIIWNEVIAILLQSFIVNMLNFMPYTCKTPVQLTHLLYSTGIFSAFPQTSPSLLEGGSWRKFDISLQFQTCEPHALMHSPNCNFTICTIDNFPSIESMLHSILYLYKKLYFIATLFVQALLLDLHNTYHGEFFQPPYYSALLHYHCFLNSFLS